MKHNCKCTLYSSKSSYICWVTGCGQNAKEGSLCPKEANFFAITHAVNLAILPFFQPSYSPLRPLPTRGWCQSKIAQGFRQQFLLCFGLQLAAGHIYRKFLVLSDGGRGRLMRPAPPLRGILKFWKKYRNRQRPPFAFALVRRLCCEDIFLSSLWFDGTVSPLWLFREYRVRKKQCYGAPLYRRWDTRRRSFTASLDKCFLLPVKMWLCGWPCTWITMFYNAFKVSFKDPVLWRYKLFRGSITFWKQHI